MLHILIQIIAFQVLFLLVYDLFLKRETFFNYNRAYLLLTSLLSVVLPFLKFPKLKTITTRDIVINLPEVFIGTKTPTPYEISVAEQAGIIMEQPQTPLWQTIALIGIAVSILIFLFKITKLFRLKHQNPKRWQGNVLIVNLIKSSAAFSFFNTIFLGERIPEMEKSIICKHELVHIKELHTLDLLFFEILRIVFWFNPLVYIYQNRIKELHEYSADAKAVKQNGKVDYYQSLLNQVFDVNTVSFTNTFFKKSLIKKRIAMLQKTKSKQLNLIKYALLFPMVFGMLIYTSTEVSAQEITKQEKIIDQELTEEELVKTYYKEMETMKKNGVNVIEISDYSGFGKGYLEKFIVSREEYLKSKAFMKFMADAMIERKYSNGTISDQDFETAENMQLYWNQSYEQYKNWKKTDRAKEHWELDTKDGVLKLFVADLAHKTKAEEKRFDDLLKQLERDDYFKKLVITDGKSTLEVDSFESPNAEEKALVKVEETLEVPFSVVDEVPTLIECKDLVSNRERKDCMNNFVNKHIGLNFNTKLADSLNPGRKRIFVQFKIDTNGTVKAIKARGPSVALEAEAKRVLSTLPQFIPGRQKGELVVVPFSIPIVFEVAGDIKKPETDSTLLERIRKKEQTIIDRRKLAIPFSEVEVVPTLSNSDCKSVSGGIEGKECVAIAINKLVGENFNMNLAKVLDLPPGKKRIFVLFTIDKKGDVTNIIARGPHPKLEEEAVRVLKLIPQFKPGKHRGKVVDVYYSLPIICQIRDDNKD
jgi:bla regulator protein BlaR1